MTESLPDTDANQRRHRTAYHEAGHAVTAYLLRACTNWTVTIVETDDKLGGASGEEWLGDDWTESSVGDLIKEFYAGFAAEIRFAPLHENEARLGASDDDERAAYYVGFLAGTPADIERRLREETSEFIEREWAAVERVAAELLEHGTLTCDEIECVIDIVKGNQTEQELIELRAAIRGVSQREAARRAASAVR